MTSTTLEIDQPAERPLFNCAGLVMNDAFQIKPATTTWVLVLGKTWFYFADSATLFRGWQSLGGDMYAIVSGELRRLAA